MSTTSEGRSKQSSKTYAIFAYSFTSFDNQIRGKVDISLFFDMAMPWAMCSLPLLQAYLYDHSRSFTFPKSWRVGWTGWRVWKRNPSVKNALILKENEGSAEGLNNFYGLKNAYRKGVGWAPRPPPVPSIIRLPAQVLEPGREWNTWITITLFKFRKYSPVVNKRSRSNSRRRRGWTPRYRTSKPACSVGKDMAGYSWRRSEYGVFNYLPVKQVDGAVGIAVNNCFCSSDNCCIKASSIQTRIDLKQSSALNKKSLSVITIVSIPNVFKPLVIPA